VRAEVSRKAGSAIVSSSGMGAQRRPFQGTPGTASGGGAVGDGELPAAMVRGRALQVGPGQAGGHRPPRSATATGWSGVLEEGSAPPSHPRPGRPSRERREAR